MRTEARTWNDRGFDAMPALPSAPLERAACLVLLAFAAALQLSIAAADILLTIVTVLWIGLLIRNKERVEVPGMFWPLAAYAAATLVASVFSVDRPVSLVDCKHLLLPIIVPLAYRLFRLPPPLPALHVLIPTGA